MKRIFFMILAVTVFSSTLLAAPSPKLGELQYLTGHWKCTGTAFPFLGMPEHKTTSTIEGTWAFDNHWLQFHYKEPRTAANPTPVEVQYFWGWDDQTKQFASVAVDNGGGHFAQSSQGWEGDRITFEGDMHIAGNTMRFHDVFTRVNATTLGHKGEAMMDGKWTKLDEETCTKQVR